MARRKRKELAMLVVKSNDMIRNVRFSLTVNQQKLIAYLIAKIKPTDEYIPRFTIRVEDFCALLGIDKNNAYKRFFEMIDDFKKKTFLVDTPTKIYTFFWFAEAEYNKGDGSVTVGLAPSLRDYLLELKANFTQYELINIMALKSKYSIRIFELLKSYQYKNEIILPIEQLRQLLCTANYKTVSEFIRRAIAPAITEINLYTELEVSYEPIKRGRKFEFIKFMIHRKADEDVYDSMVRTMDVIDKEQGILEGQVFLDELDELELAEEEFKW